MKTRRGNSPKAPHKPPHCPNAPTGIMGLDEITGGGLPQGRPTLVCGAAGSGKNPAGHPVPRERRQAV